ncbi:MAG: terminase large subunit [Chloroflexota bacterium]
MADPVSVYALDVVAGRIVTGSLVRLACERHLRDLAEGSARGLRFDAVEAAAAIEFWELCPHLKGRAAKRGETLKLEGWQRFIIGSVYGWKRADGRRRFRVAWVEVARKNGKSTLLYPAALHALTLDGEEGAEVYSVATKRDQAKLVFDLAKRAVTRTPDLAECIQAFAFTLVAEETFSKFEAVSADADTLDGLNPHVALCDEIHKWRGRALWDVIETGMGAREQPILWAITTAGEEGEEDAYGQEHNHGVDVLRGLIEDDGRFVYVACLDPEDDWTDPANIVKANPNLGVSVEREEIEGQIRKAKQSPAAANAVKRLRLGLRTQDADCWIPLPLWDKGRDDRARWDRLKGYPCFAGLDLASSSDFAALALAFPLTEDWEPAPDLQRPALWAYLFRLWMPGEGRNHREQKLREIAAPWIEAGDVIRTDGDCIDPAAIEAGAIEAADWFQVVGLAYDPFNATSTAQRLTEHGIDCGKFTQAMTSFAEPTKVFEADLLSGHVRHGGNPCARWMMANAVSVTNGAGHAMPSRKRSRNKIDAVVAAVMARGRALAGGGPQSSYYDSNPIEVA